MIGGCVGRYEIARARISKLDGGRFQALAYRYVRFKYHIDYANWYGMSPGTTTPVKGHPDGFLVLPNGHMYFIECGHVENKSAAIAKLQGDINEILDYEREHPKDTIDRIICCYSCGRLNPEQVSELERLDTKGRIEFIGPDTLADECVTKCPWLANEYLDMSLGNGAIVDSAAFLDRYRNNAFTPNLDHELVCRDDEVKSLAKIIEANKAVLVAGASGCGKTKLVLETLRRLADKHDADLYVIPPSKSELHEDIQACCIDDKETYLFLDDANDLGHISTIVNLVNSKQNVRVVATVRSYAKKSVSHELKAVQLFSEYELDALPDDSVDRILKEQFGIESPAARRGITGIAKGNLRIACLASDLVRGGGSINLRTIKEVFDAAYERFLDTLSDEEKIAISIASLLGPHKTNCNQDLNELRVRFGISINRYVDACRKLYAYELMDATPGFEAVSFEEQNLRDYFLHHSVIEAKRITIADIWASPKWRRSAIAIYQRIADVFSDKETIEELRKQVRRLLHAVDDAEKLDVVIAFGPELGMEGVACVGELMYKVSPDEQAQTEGIDYGSLVKSVQKGRFDSKELAALARFLDDSLCWETALNLAFTLIRRGCVSVSDLCELFTWRLNGVIQSYPLMIDRATKVFDSLEDGNLFQDDTMSSLCLIMFVRGLLMDERMDAISTDDAHFTTRRVKLMSSRELLELRERGLRILANMYCQLFMQRSITKIVLSYTGAMRGDGQLIKHTYELIATIFIPVINADTFEECERIAGFAANCQCLGIEKAKVLGKLDLSKAQGLAITLSTEMLHKPNYLDNAIQEALELSVADWQDFFALLDPPDQAIKYEYQLKELIDAIMQDARTDERIRETVARGAVSRTSPRTVLPAGPVIQFYYQSYGIEAGRARLEQDAGMWVGAWLASFDSYLLEKGVGLDVSQMVESLYQRDEVLPFASVCQAERLSSGFMEEYIRELACYFGAHPIPYSVYLPYPLEEFDSLTEGILMDSGIGEALAELASALTLQGQIPPNGAVIARIAVLSPASTSTVFEALMSRNDAGTNRGFVAHLIAAHGSDFCLGMVQYSMPEEKSYSDWHHQREFVLMVLQETKNAGFDARANEWIVRHALCRESGLQDIVLDVIPSLDYAWRREICRELAKAGACEEVYAKAALGSPFNGYTWRDSAIPLLEARLEYFQMIRYDLLSESRLEYLRIVNSEITALEGEIAKTKIDEFVDPILHRRSNGA